MKGTGAEDYIKKCPDNIARGLASNVLFFFFNFFLDDSF